MKMRGDERLTKSYKLEKLGLSKGSTFKYIFDFGDEWRFQCKLLREIEEKTDIPGVVRSVGEAPEQYPAFDEDGEDWDEEEEDGFPGFLPDDAIQSLFRSLPIPMATVRNIHTYFEATARLYGVITLEKLLEIYNSQNEPVAEDVFYVLAEMIRHEKNLFVVLDRHEIDPFLPPQPISQWEVIDEALLSSDPEEYWQLLKGHKGKTYKILPKQELLRYADADYYPATPQSNAMKRYLLGRGDLSNPIDLWMGIQTMIEIDFTLQEVLEQAEQYGLTFDKKHDISEFTYLFQELNNHTRKQINRGHTPDELFSESFRGRKLAERISPSGQLSMFDMPTAPLLTKQPSRNAPCPCGSGRKHKNRCGKKLS